MGDLTGLVGEDRLEAVPIVVGEGELRAGMRALAADDHPRPGRPALQIEVAGDLSDLPVGTRAAVLLKRWDPVSVRDFEDRGAHRLGQVISHGEADPALAAPVQQLVAGASGVDAQQQLDGLDVPGGDLLDGLLGDSDLVDGAIRARVSRPQFTSQRFACLIRVGEHRVKPVAALEVPRRALLLRMRTDERGVQVDRQTLRSAGQLPHARPCRSVSLTQPLQALGSRAIRSTSRNAVDAEATPPNNGC